MPMVGRRGARIAPCVPPRAAPPPPRRGPRRGGGRIGMGHKGLRAGGQALDPLAPVRALEPEPVLEFLVADLEPLEQLRHLGGDEGGGDGTRFHHVEHVHAHVAQQHPVGHRHQMPRADAPAQPRELLAQARRALRRRPVAPEPRLQPGARPLPMLGERDHGDHRLCSLARWRDIAPLVANHPERAKEPYVEDSQILAPRSHQCRAVSSLSPRFSMILIGGPRRGPERIRRRSEIAARHRPQNSLNRDMSILR